MKKLLMIIAVLGLSQVANAEVSKLLSDNLYLVQENLNKTLYSFNSKIISFSIFKNREVAQLQILNNICPKVHGGFSCFAMPAVVLNANFEIQHVETDSCGIQTYVSSIVDVGHRWANNSISHFAQIRIKDYSQSICEMVYVSDVEVELEDTMVDSELQKTEVHFSTMLFDYSKNTGPVVLKAFKQMKSQLITE